MFTNSKQTNDLWWISSASLQSLLPIAEAGGRVVMSVLAAEAQGHIHAKVAVADERFVIVGSWNCWLRSHVYEVEVDMLVENAELAKYITCSMDEMLKSPAYPVWSADDLRAAIAEDPTLHGMDKRFIDTNFSCQ